MTYTKKVSTKKMRKSTKKSHTRKKRINIGGGETITPRETINPSFTNKLIHRVLLLIEGLILESIDQLGNTLGLDVSNPQQVNAKLDELKILVSDPETQEKVRIIVGKMGILLSIAFEAVDPYIQPLADKINKIYVQSTSELGKSSITILKNIAKAIPVYGAIVALIDMANTITVTGANSVSAKEHVQSAYDDALIAASINFKEIFE